MVRRRLLAVGLVSVTSASIAVSVIVQHLPTHQDRLAAMRDAAVLARRACTNAALVVTDIGRNAASDRVLARLTHAQHDAQEAADETPRWIQLDSGLQAMLASLRTDDPRLAEVGLEVVRTSCRDVDVAI